MCVWKWQPNRRTASWSYARLCDIDTHINSLENISHTQWDSWFLLISSNIATIPCQIPEHTTAFVGFHVFPCLSQRGRVAPSERSRLPLRGLVLSTRGVHSEFGCAPRTNALDNRHRLVEDLHRVSAGVSSTHVRYGDDREWVHLYDAHGMSEATIPIQDALYEACSELADPRKLQLYIG